MKGNPLLRLFFILLALGLVAWPVCRLTMRPSWSTSASTSGSPLESLATSSNVSSAASSAFSSNDTESATSARKNTSLQATLSLRVAPAPLHCSIMQGGRTLLTESNLTSPGEYRVTAALSSGEDLLVAAEWTGEEPHALHAEVMMPGHVAPLEKTFWAGRTLQDSFPIPEHSSTPQP